MIHSPDLQPFHLAIQVRCLSEAREFYGSLLDCPEGRSSEIWVDFNLFGHQLVCHLNQDLGPNGKVTSHTNPVDGHTIPVPHFGVVLELDQWYKLAEILQKKNLAFTVEPTVRFKGDKGEQATMFFYDPSGNALEFKAFKDRKKKLFAV
jgi:hypothetical protein|tara:strand:+ start:267 stop:713 length:447 start_codon:yes stop_codon:yes gene_type:complete